MDSMGAVHQTNQLKGSPISIPTIVLKMLRVYHSSLGICYRQTADKMVIITIRGYFLSIVAILVFQHIFIWIVSSMTLLEVNESVMDLPLGQNKSTWLTCLKSKTRLCLNLALESNWWKSIETTCLPAAASRKTAQQLPWNTFQWLKWGLRLLYLWQLPILRS